MNLNNKITIYILAIITCYIINIQSLPLSTDDNFHNARDYVQQRQLFFDAKTKETNPPNFMRLVIMRLIYGLASTMGIEERLEDTFNGAFVPPNADNDLMGIFGASGADNDDGGGAGDYAEIFDDY